MVLKASPKRRLSVGAPGNVKASCSPWTAVKGVQIGPPRRPGRRLGVQVVALGDFGRPGQLERETEQTQRESQIGAGIGEIRHGK
jgi:hypothetical protein